MTNTEQLNQLRELMLTAPESTATRVMAIVVSVSLVISVLWLVRTKDHVSVPSTPRRMSLGKAACRKAKPGISVVSQKS